MDAGGPGLQQCLDKAVRATPRVSKWMTPLGLKSGPSWTVGPLELTSDVEEMVEWGQP